MGINKVVSAVVRLTGRKPGGWKLVLLIVGSLVLIVPLLAVGTSALIREADGQKSVASGSPHDATLVAVTDDEPPKRLGVRALPKPPPPVDLAPHVGSRGPQILDIEQKLDSLKYMVGKVDGVFDRATYHGVVAFQKVERLKRDGRGNDETLARLATASVPQPAYATPSDHLEVDIVRQVVFVVRGSSIAQILPTSTGSNKSFTSQGWTRKAITPNGQFQITRKINAMRISPLGELYKPSYFNGGIAFHGNGSVPTGPASHGCVRLPMQFADWFFSNASSVGTVVYVHGGPSGPNPQPVIDDKPAPEPLPAPEPEPSPPLLPIPLPSIPPLDLPTPTPGDPLLP